ncbi:hypothetical protein BGZ49_007041 [Haplosporangium sp. Z 27]|nr:hypothetical protein BGZ49_007041 [Haplosporangium sp. Z 27]
MSNLFTWHGYVMLLFGSFYVFFYGASHYMTSAPAITGVAIGFACMGLVPFFTLLALLLAALILLYTFYIVFVCVIWPLEKFGLSRRRAISRRNGGYRSDGTTNTTDIREVERTIGNVDNVRGGGLGGVDKIKITPAMAAIPIVIYRKPKVKQTDNTTGEVKVSSKQKDITDQSDVQSENTNINVPTETMEVIQDTGDSKKHQKANEGVETTSVGIVKSSSKEDLCSISTSDTPNISKSPQPIAGDGYVAITMDSSNSNHNDAINKVPSGLSSISDSVTGLPQSHNAISRSRSSSTSTGNSGSSWVNIAASHTTPTSSFIPCATGQEMAESEARMRLSTPTLLSTVASLKPKDFVQKSASNNKSVTIDNHDVASNTNNRGQYMNTGHINSTISGEDGIYETTTGSESGFDSKSATSNDLSKDGPTINDEECAICLYDFEDGDELRHLYCDHFFHRSCVDKWLSKNAFCPKCKRSI